MSKYVTYNKKDMGWMDWLFVLLQVLFVAFKLMDIIEWQWWEVLLPIIVRASIVGGAVFVVFSIYVYAHVAYAWRRYQRSKR